MKEKFKLLGAYITVAIIAIGFAYGMWVIKREINFAWDYEDKVKQTCSDMYEQRIRALEKDGI